MKSKLRWAFVALLSILAGFSQVSCEKRRAPSVLVIAVDSLPFSLSLCSRDGDEQKSGFATLCRESIRFTHAYTPSTLSVPALASILTGLYPFEHRVRSNGSSGLSPRTTTIAESALQRGYRTGLFSGGAPLWRRTGLQQGFEVFDDLVSFSGSKLFRSLQESSERFQDWLVHDVQGEPFLGLIYAPDLNFTDTITETLSGELRGLSYDSQIEEMEENLEELFRFLKSQNRWDDTMVVLVGLNGRESTPPRPGEIEPLNLHSENSQVSLFVKPPQRPRDEALSWTVDRNVSLADFGPTILELIGVPPSSGPLEERPFPVVSLMSGLRGSQPDWAEDRPILIESAWAEWQGLGTVRSAVFRNHDLTIYDSPARTFNTLIDRFELSPLANENVDANLLARMRRAGSRAWAPVGGALRRSLTIPPLQWLSPRKSKELHSDLLRLAQDPFAHPRVLRWAAQSSLEQKDWKTLRLMGQRMARPGWTDIADRLLGKKNEVRDPCLSLLFAESPDGNMKKACSDELFMNFFAWWEADRAKSKEKDELRKRFLIAWEGAQADLRILRANAGLGLIWLPLSAESQIPSRTALALALPEGRARELRQ